MLTDGRWAPQLGNWLIRRFVCMQSCTARFLGLVLLYVCVKCGHASVLRRLDGRLKAKGTGHALNARMLGTPLPNTNVTKLMFSFRATRTN